MMVWLSLYFGTELWIALTEVTGSALVDLVLTLVLVLMGRLIGPDGQPVRFSWRRLPQFLYTNVAPAAGGVLLGAVLVRYYPDLREEYLIATTGMAAWLARDWRWKFMTMIGAWKPESVSNQRGA